MIAGGRNADFVELGKGQHGMSRAVTTGGRSEDSHSRRIHIRIARGHLLDQGHVVFERSA